ncbi:MAG TPA: DNA polymerase IV [Anaerolineales bacterium]|nr:DNA polymerase IV [Anaerolineales bacterium]
MPRKILHLDLDAFFCSVEELHDPSLRGIPFAVGGMPDERGVVASCSYAARQHGVRSAMPMARAVQLVPKLVIVPSRHHTYGEVSRQVMQHLFNLTPLVEQLSIDEAFLDVSDLPDASLDMAQHLQKTILHQLGLPCSLGGATNKLTAKIATDVGKALHRGGTPPNAITIVPPGQEAAFLAPLPTIALWGIGPKTASRLAELGIHTIGDIVRWPKEDLEKRFGKLGTELSIRAQGVDESPIITEHNAKSISQETTYAHDISDQQVLKQTLRTLAARVAQRLRKEGLYSATIKIKLRWADFSTITRQVTLPQPGNLDEEIFQAALALFEKAHKPGQSVRLLGVGAGNLQNQTRQLSLWQQASTEPHNLQAAIDAVRQRYGNTAIKRGSELEARYGTRDETKP